MGILTDCNPGYDFNFIFLVFLDLSHFICLNTLSQILAKEPLKVR